MAFEIGEAYVSVRPQVDKSAVASTSDEIGSLLTRGIGAGVMANGARTVGPAVKGFLTETFDQSALLQSLGNKAATVFGEELGTVEAWASESANAMGLTESAAVGLAAGMGDLLVPMGFTREEAANMATETTGLAGALSEWSGGTTTAAQASEILTKAMLGERDGLKSLGISISAAEVEARLLQKGQEDLTGAAKQQAEALATQELIMEKSTDAQAAFADGSSNLLRSQAELTAQMAEGKDMLANAMIPVLGGVLGAVNALPGPMGELVLGFAGIGAQIAPMLGSVAQMAVGFQAAGLSMSSITGPIAKAASGFGSLIASAASATASVVASIGRQIAAWVLLGVQSLVHAAKVAAAWLIAMGPIALVIAAVVGLVAIIVLNWDKIKEVIGKGWDWVKEKSAAVWEWIKEKVSAIGQAIADFFMNWTLIGIIIKHWDDIKAWTAAAWDWVKEKVQGVAQAILDFFLNWTLPGLIIKHWDDIKAAAGRAWDWILEKVQEVIDWFKGIPAKISEAFSSLWDIITAPFDRAFNWVEERLDGLMSRVRGAIEQALPGQQFGDDEEAASGGGSRGGSGSGGVRHMAAGTRMQSGLPDGGSYIVGERGPELVTLNQGSGVTPANVIDAAIRGIAEQTPHLVATNMMLGEQIKFLHAIVANTANTAKNTGKAVRTYPLIMGSGELTTSQYSGGGQRARNMALFNSYGMSV